MIKGEAVFKGETEVKYLFQKSSTSQSLVVVFSAFGAEGKPPAYNYLRALEGYDCNKLYILDDFGCRASYYLCKKRDFYIERSIISLIEQIVRDNDIKRVISCGSSKGGYAAIYYGVKYDFDSVISGSPQYFLGDYLFNSDSLTDVSRFIAGGSDMKDKEFMNAILQDTVRASKSSPRLYIHVGQREYHYNHHVKPLIEEMNKKGIQYDLDLGDYSDHADVAKHFPEYLKRMISKETEVPYIKLLNEPNPPVKINERHEFHAHSSDPESTFAWYLYKDGKTIEKRMYTPSNKTTINFDEAGQYQLKVFVKNSDNRKVTAKSKIINVKEAPSD
ncbi:Two component regulator three Y domain-containing protein [Bacillus sp. FSL K6-1284]|uniref:Two component regulator three Y domain-containing protein n=1 Tax=Bacillus sp. FSL K6-1284 TaxID=2921468 RepID=UPI0030F75940